MNREAISILQFAIRQDLVKTIDSKIHDIFRTFPEKELQSHYKSLNFSIAAFSFSQFLPS